MYVFIPSLTNLFLRSNCRPNLCSPITDLSEILASNGATVILYIGTVSLLLGRHVYLCVGRHDQGVLSSYIVADLMEHSDKG